MNTFDWLVIGHLIADWLLQSRNQATYKTQGNLFNQAILVHSLVYAFSFIPIFLIMQIHFGWLLFLFFSHLFLDRRWPVLLWLEKAKGLTKEEIQEKELLVIMTDQICHLLVLVIIVVFS